MGQCIITPDRKAQDMVAKLFGCPDCPGMVDIKGSTLYTICYWVKRPKGKIVLFGALGAALYFFVLKKK